MMSSVISLCADLGDNRWHHVEVTRRRRVETMLIVDGETDIKVTFGNDFQFGNGSNRLALLYSSSFLFIYLNHLFAHMINVKKK